MTKKFTYKTKPFEHQRNALKAGAREHYFAYFMQMGTGKTKVTIDNMSYLYVEDKIDTVVVVAPNSVYQNWLIELDIHCSVNYHTYTHKVDKKFVYKDNVLNYYLINVEAFSHTKGYKLIEKILDQRGLKVAMVIDEATTIKNRTASRTKNLIKLGRGIKYKRILTGSPVTKSPLDLFAQCEFLQQGLLGHKSFYTFQARHAVLKQLSLPGQRSTMIPTGTYMNIDELEQKIKTFSFRVTKDECMDLPDKIYLKRDIILSTEQRHYYDQLKKHSRALLLNDMISFNNKLTEIIKLQQVCNGFVKTDSGDTINMKDAKMQELHQVIDEHDGKVIIWSSFVHNIETIIKNLEDKFGKGSTVAIYGAVSVKDRNENVRKFQTNPKVRFFVGNPVTGGYGLNLTKATLVVYYNNSFNLEVRTQSEDRAHRHGQEKEVTYVDLIAKGTIDEFVVKSLVGKHKLSAQTLGEEAVKFL